MRVHSSGICQPHAQSAYYTRTATTYDSMHGMDKEHLTALELITETLSRLSCRSVLDVGCGTGRGVSYLLARGYEAVGLDPVRKLLDIGVRNHSIPPERLYHGDGTKLPFKNNEFDATIALGVMHHVPKPEYVIQEMLRVSKTAIFVSDSNRFGQGPTIWRYTKLLFYKLRLGFLLNAIRTNGKGFTISEEDGIAYSYSVFDTVPSLTHIAKRTYVVPTTTPTTRSTLHPLLTTSHGLLVCEELHPQQFS